ncbi:MAG TPA: hypothetical protein VIX19_16285 [Terriglobales bacterium]
MPRHILSVAYDKALLDTRAAILEARGYQVTSALGFSESIDQCERGGFDLFLVGHSIPQVEIEKMIAVLRNNCRCPVLLLLAPFEPIANAAEHAEQVVVSTEPDELLEAVAKTLET